MYGMIVRYRIRDPIAGDSYALRIFSVEDPWSFQRMAGPEFDTAIRKIKASEEERGRAFLGVAAII